MSGMTVPVDAGSKFLLLRPAVLGEFQMKSVTDEE
jgi:hypothetical protein